MADWLAAETSDRPLFSGPEARRLVRLLRAAGLLLGLGWIALMPQFAGPDEEAHYARIEALAFPPATRAQSFYTAQDAAACLAKGPMPHMWILHGAFDEAMAVAQKTGGQPDLAGALRRQGYLEYDRFFAADGRAQDYIRLCRELPGQPAFSPTKTLNWEFQHPPLYYLLLAPALRAGAALPLLSRLLLLRSLSFLMAFSGLVFGLRATFRHYKSRRDAMGDVAVFSAFYPFLMPAFFFELCRVGNDALVVAMFAAQWALLLLHLRAPRDRMLWGALGLLAGYGCLVKAYMIAISAGMFLFMGLQPARAGEGKRRFLPAATAAAVAAVVSLPFYAPVPGNAFHGSFDLYNLLHGGGTRTARHIPWAAIGENMLHMVNSMVFEFSGVALSRSALLANGLLPALLAAPVFFWARSLPRDPRREEWLPVFTLAPLIAGVAAWGVVMPVVFRVSGYVAGQYIHAAAPAVALIVGTGLRRLAAGRGGIAVTALLGLAVAGNLLILFMQALVHAGCLVEGPQGLTPGPAGCVADLYRRMAVLAWPGLALACLVPAFCLLGAALVMASRRLARGGMPVPALKP